MEAEQRKLHAHIKALEKDIANAKKEIEERDETIQDKENRIYDLKKKNQELEKFKFVLDYKIRELKKQIEPREKDIVDMKVQIGQVRRSDGCSHPSARADGPGAGQVPRPQHVADAADPGTAGKVQHLRDGAAGRAHALFVHPPALCRCTHGAAVADIKTVLKRFKADVHNAMKLIQEPHAFSSALRQIYTKYVHTVGPRHFISCLIRAGCG